MSFRFYFTKNISNLSLQMSIYRMKKIQDATPDVLLWAHAVIARQRICICKTSNIKMAFLKLLRVIISIISREMYLLRYRNRKRCNYLITMSIARNKCRHFVRLISRRILMPLELHFVETPLLLQGIENIWVNIILDHNYIVYFNF